MSALIAQLKKIDLPAIKICLSGSGKVAGGAQEILEAIGMKKVSISDYLNKSFDSAVYCKIGVLDYAKRTDNEKGSLSQFIKDPSAYETDFLQKESYNFNIKIRTFSIFAGK